MSRDAIAETLAATKPSVLFMADTATDGEMRRAAMALAEELPGIPIRVIAIDDPDKLRLVLGDERRISDGS